MANKMTKKDYFAQLRVLAEGNKELVAFIDHEVELLTKKSSSTKPTARQEENEKIKALIRIVLNEQAEPITISKLMEYPELDYSNQRLTALLTQMSNVGEVVRTEVKGRAYFALTR